MRTDNGKSWPRWRTDMHEVIFEADSRAGKGFDVALLILIVISILAVMVETVPSIDSKFHWELIRIEWVLTVLFTIEYIARIVSVRKPLTYMFSFFGIVDLLAILPSYLELFLPGQGHSLAVIRALRLLRIFRIFKLARYMREGKVIMASLRNSRVKIIVFLVFILTMVCIIGAFMYLIEGSDSGFDSIPKSMYWAVVTLTTVGYGDIAPVTPLGQFLAALIMIMGYGIIAVPTGIVTADIVRGPHRDPLAGVKQNVNSQHCIDCGKEDHEDDAKFCRHCGFSLDREKDDTL